MRSRRAVLQELGVTAVALSFGDADFANTAEAKRLNFYNWDTYIGETTLDDFKRDTGIAVKMDLYSGNDELFAKLRGGNPGYDVIVPSHDFVERMIASKMLSPLDHQLLPNFKNIAPRYKDLPFDPGNLYSVPYTFLVLGIGYRKSKVKPAPISWKEIFDSDHYAGRIAWYAEALPMFGLYARYLGKSVNALTADDIAEIEVLMVKQKSSIKKFHYNEGQNLLLKGDVDLVIEWNGDIAQIMPENDKIGFVVPNEGSLIYCDNFCIPRRAPHPKNAHAFINYLLDRRTGKHITETILYPTPNYAARAMMPASYKYSPVLFPSDATLARCEYPRYNKSRQTLIEEAFTRVRAA